MEPEETEVSEQEVDEEEGFASLIAFGNREGDQKVTGWNCPVGANTR